MRRYLVHRILTAIVVMLGVSVIAFVLPRLTGDPAIVLMGEGATPEMIEETREFWGLNQPLHMQYWTFLCNVAKGGLGDSLVSGRPATAMIAEAFPNTLKLALCAWCFAVLVGTPLGLLAALRRNGAVDIAVRVLSMLGRGMPHFWIGIMLILLFAVRLRWLPSSGTAEGVAGLRYIAMPAFVLGLGSMSVIVRMIRSEMLETLRRDYITAAVARGLAPARVVCVYALKNAFIPILTVMGLEIGGMMGGAIVTETVFAYPGLGRLAVASIFGIDYPMIQALILLFAFIFILVNLAVDILYALLDPRIRYE